MILRSWDRLPDGMRTEAVRPYFDALDRKRGSLILKRLFDVTVSAVMLLILWPFMLLMALAVKLDSPGPAFFKQERVTAYGRKFEIVKFRTMVQNAESMGSQVTVNRDRRVTRLGRILRKSRLDELPQLFNVLSGNMSYVGTRPEVAKYVARYTPEMMATLLLPAGITSEASIQYKDEEKLLAAAEDVDEVYVNQVLPGKMKYNLEAIMRFSVWQEVALMLRTVAAVLFRERNQ